MSSPTHEVIAAAVRAYMAARRLNQHAMSARLGWSQTALAARLTGRTRWTSRDVDALAAAGVPVSISVSPSLILESEAAQ